MTNQRQKELRALRPAGLAAMILAIAPAFAPEIGGGDFWTTAKVWGVFLFVGGVLLGSELFGREFSLNTFQGFLVAPVSRSWLWGEKIRALATLLGIVLTLASGVFCLRTSVPLNLDSRLPAGLVAMTVILATGAGSGLFWVLFTRQSAAAFWLAIVIPCLLCGLGELLLTWCFGAGAAFWTWAAGLPLVGIASWLGANRLFRRAQDTGTHSLELGGWFTALTHLAPRRKTHNSAGTAWTGLRALLWKELGLQQFNLVLALGLGTAVALVLLVLQLFGNDRPDRNNALQSTVMLWYLIWTVVPFLIGTVAFAEERRLRVDEWQSTLPVSIWRQWWVKLGVVFGLGLLLGVILPTLIERVLPLASVSSTSDYQELLIRRLWVWSGGCLLAFYASSLSRNLIQALSGLVALGAGVFGWVMLSAWCVHFWQQSRNASGYADLLIVGVAIFLLAPLSLALSRWNFRGPQARPGFVRTNTLALASAAALILLLPLALLDRVWERAWREPRPGPAIPQRSDVTPALLVNPTLLNIVLAPDGGLYAWWQASDRPLGENATNGFLHIAASDGVVPLHPDHDWVSVAATPWAAYFVKADGSLWRLTHPAAAAAKTRPRHFGDTDERRDVDVWWATETNFCWSTGRPVIERWNSGDDWKTVAAGAHHIVALKDDGTLWGWGDNGMGQLGRSDLSQTAEPIQIGNHHDWQLVAAAATITLAANAEGQVWQWGGWQNRKLSPEDKAQPKHLTSANHWVRLVGSDLLRYGIQADGLVCRLPSPPAPGRDSTHPLPRDAAVLSQTPWRSSAIAYGGYPIAIVVDADGRLWSIPPAIWNATQPLRVMGDPGSCTRIGSRSDWIALGSFSSFPPAYYGLTADGILWCWGGGSQNAEPSILDRLGVPPSSRPRPFARLSAPQTR